MNKKNIKNEKFLNREGFLFEQEVVINNVCDEDCVFCSIDVKAKDNKRIFSFNFSEIAENLRLQKQVSNSIKITGGEPTLHPKLLEIIKIAEKIGFSNVCIETNGQNFSDKEFSKKVIDFQN